MWAGPLHALAGKGAGWGGWWWWETAFPLHPLGQSKSQSSLDSRGSEINSTFWSRGHNVTLKMVWTQGTLEMFPNLHSSTQKSKLCKTQFSPLTQMKVFTFWISKEKKKRWPAYEQCFTGPVESELDGISSSRGNHINMNDRDKIWKSLGTLVKI